MAILDISDLNDEQRRRLMLAGAAAGGTFAFLLIAGALAGSQALIADGLDFAALAVSTGLALILKEAPAAMRAGARLVITVVLGLIGLAVALATLHGFAARVTPEPSLMGAAALVALAANGTTLYLLREEREGTSVLRGLWFAARTDLVGGHVDMMFDAVSTMSGLVDSGKVRALGVTSTKRSVVLPNVPTMAQAGLPGYTATLWLGLLAPKGTPKAVVDTLNRDIAKIVQREDIRTAWAKSGVTPLSMSPGEFTHFLEQDIAKWREIGHDAHISVN